MRYSLRTIKVFFWGLSLGLLMPLVAVQAMSSTSYQINWDSLNTGGLDTGSSASYQLLYTTGEGSVGTGTSASYTLPSGYQTGTGVATLPACSNLLDDDGDGFIDLADPGCSSASDTDETDGSVVHTSVCGNGIPESGEQCDDGNQNNTDSCLNTCQAAYCGDSAVHSGVEGCDDGNTTNGDGCSATCQIETQLPICGNSALEQGEGCDDGNTTNGDGCSATCQVETQQAVCGNASIETGEQCDDGNTTNGDGCSSTCQTETQQSACGNTVVETGEGCDDGNTTNGDGCSASCQVEIQQPICGNSSIETGEGCDDGNTTNGDGCSASCQVETQQPICGNSTIETGEQCDDGNVNNGDGCSTSCQVETVPPLCGNTVVEQGEGCDDGNVNNGDGCSASCQIETTQPVCGNGQRESGEGCDDGNTTNGDGCSASCQLETQQQPACGNARQEVGEGCDDGNTTNGDGCSASCQVETVVEKEQTETQSITEKTIATITTATEALVAKVLDIAPILRTTVLPVARVVQREVLDNPVVEETTTDIVLPTLVTVNLVTTATALPSLAFLPYLLSLIFTEPLRFLFFRRRKYGAVYNSITKQPIDLAIVRLYDNHTNRLVTTRVTDVKGRYSIVADPGEYYLKVQKDNHIFPSSTLGQKVRDHDYADLYYGAPITLTEQDNLVNLNIPLDPNLPTLPDQTVVWQDRVKRWRKRLAYAGPLLALVGAIIVPSKLSIGLVALHVVLFLAFRRLAVTYRPKSFGTVFDNRTRRALKNTVVRVFDTQYNKLLAAQVANSSGRYNFLVGPNTYYITASRDAYQPYKSDTLDYRQAQEVVIDHDVPLRKTGEVGTTPQAAGAPGSSAPVPPPVAPLSPVTPPPPATPPTPDLPPQTPPPAVPPPTPPVASPTPAVSPVSQPSIPPAPQAPVPTHDLEDTLAQYSGVTLSPAPEEHQPPAPAATPTPDSTSVSQEPQPSVGEHDQSEPPLPPPSSMPPSV